MVNFERIRQWIENWFRKHGQFDDGSGNHEQEHRNLEKGIKEAKKWQDIKDALDNFGISYWTHEQAADMYEEMIEEFLLDWAP